MVQNNSSNGLLWIMQKFPCAFCLWLKIGLALRVVGPDVNVHCLFLIPLLAL